MVVRWGTSIALVMSNQSKLDYREKCSHLEGLLPVWDRCRACIFKRRKCALLDVLHHSLLLDLGYYVWL